MVIAALLLVSTLGFSTAQSMASAPALSIANATAPAPASSPTAQTSASAPTQSPGLTNLNSAVKFTFNVSAIQKDGSWVNVSHQPSNLSFSNQNHALK